MKISSNSICSIQLQLHMGSSQIIRNWIRSKFVQSNSKFAIRLIWKVKIGSKNWIRIKSKFVQFDSTSTKFSSFEVEAEPFFMESIDGNQILVLGELEALTAV